MKSISGIFLKSIRLICIFIVTSTFLIAKSNDTKPRSPELLVIKSDYYGYFGVTKEFAGALKDKGATFLYFPKKIRFSKSKILSLPKPKHEVTITDGEIYLFAWKHKPKEFITVDKPVKIFISKAKKGLVFKGIEQPNMIFKFNKNGNNIEFVKVGKNYLEIHYNDKSIKRINPFHKKVNGKSKK